MKKINNLQKINPLNLSTLIRLEFYKFIARGIFGIPNNQLPEVIDEYHLTKRLRKQWKDDSNKLGIYKKRNEKKAFGKMLNYGYKNIEYLKLKNEIRLYKIINKYLSKSIIKSNPIFKTCRIPKYISFQETKDTLSLLVEFVEGVRGDKLSPEKKIKAYLEIMNFLKELGRKLSNTEKQLFSKRTSFDYIILYPFLLISALIRHPETRNNLIKGIPIFLKNFQLLFQQDELVLSHRDLHFKNLIVNNRENVLIDFESCGFTLPLHDAVTTLRYEWNNIIFTKEIIETIENTYKKSDKFENYFKLLIIIVCTHGLSANNYSKKEIRKIEKFLEYGIKYKSGNEKQR